MRIKPGMLVNAHLTRGGTVESEVVSIDRTSSIAKAYGAQVVLANGYTVGIRDCTPVKTYA